MSDSIHPWIVLRVRGSVGVKKELLYTMGLLKLHRVNHAVVLQPTPSAKGMVEKVKDYVTYGELEEKTLEQLIQKRARLAGNKRLNADWMKKNGFSNIQQLAKAVWSGEKSLESKGVKPVFRLNPPSKGFERAGIKKPYTIKGALGYRGKEINALIKRMA